jgi:hypothetical protein
MKNTMKLLGIAVVVLLTFGLAGCPPDDDEDVPPKVQIVPVGELPSGNGYNEDDPWPLGTELCLVYDGGENDGKEYSIGALKAEWQIYAWGQPQEVWIQPTDPDGLPTQAVGAKFKPTAPGRYSVIVWSPSKIWKTPSNSVYVGGAVTIGIKGAVVDDKQTYDYRGSPDDPYELNKELTAVYGGKEESVTSYLWKKLNAEKGEYDEIASATTKTFTPNANGVYLVTVTVGSSDSDSPPVVVGARDFVPVPKDFYGKWEYDKTQPLSDATTTARQNLTQTIVVKEDSFELDDGAAKFSFKIDSWSSVRDNKGHLNGSTGNYSRQKYEVAFPKGFLLTGTTTPPIGVYGSSTRLIIYMSEDKKTFIRVSPSSLTGNSPGTIVSCVYVLKEKAED